MANLTLPSVLYIIWYSLLIYLLIQNKQEKAVVFAHSAAAAVLLCVIYQHVLYNAAVKDFRFRHLCGGVECPPSTSSRADAKTQSLS